MMVMITNVQLQKNCFKRTSGNSKRMAGEVNENGVKS